MKRIIFVNGSPKGENSFSYKMLAKLISLIDEEKSIIHVNFTGKYQDKTFQHIINSDAIVFSFPLFYYCLPGVLLNFIQQLQKYTQSKNLNKKDIKVYAIVNCSSSDPEINEEAIRLIENFCDNTNLNFRFAVSICGGKFVNIIQSLLFARNDRYNINESLKLIKYDIYKSASNENTHNIVIRPFLPKLLILFISSSGLYFFSKRWT